jgi:hypothetical protein
MAKYFIVKSTPAKLVILHDNDTIELGEEVIILGSRDLLPKAGDIKPRQGRGKGPRRCKRCGETGHRSDNCPNKERSVDSIGTFSAPEVSEETAIVAQKMYEIDNTNSFKICSDLNITLAQLDNLVKTRGWVRKDA